MVLVTWRDNRCKTVVSQVLPRQDTRFETSNAACTAQREQTDVGCKVTDKRRPKCSLLAAGTDQRKPSLDPIYFSRRP